MSELKACPFCECQPRNIHGGFAACSNRVCILYGMPIKHKAWNTRTPDLTMQKVGDAAIDLVAGERLAYDRLVEALSELEEAQGKHSP